MFLKRKMLSFIRKIIGTDQLLDQLQDIKQELDSTRDELRYTKQELAEQIHHTKQELMDQQNNTKQELIDNLHHVKQDLIYKNNKIMKIVTSMILYKDKAKIFYLDTPEHGNIGDHAIAYSSTCLLQDLYPEHKIIEFTYDDWLSAKPYIIEYISDNDVIFLVGGGNMGDLWINEEEVRRSIIKSFPNNKIISMAQSITFNNKQETEISTDIYAGHSNFSIVARDQKSFETVKKLFSSNKLGISPDSALYLEEYYTEFYKDSQKGGVLFILRSDKEKARSDKKITEIQKSLKESSISYKTTDTVIPKSVEIIERKEELENILSLIATSKLVITDRYHGLIFSVITGTPCLVFKSLDHKISEGVKWFTHLDWVHYVDGDSDINPFIDKYLIQEYTVNHPKTFKKEIFSFYKNLLEK